MDKNLGAGNETRSLDCGLDPSGVSITSRPRPTVTAQFSGAQLQHRLAVRLLQVFELTLGLLAHVLRIGPQGILHTWFAVIDPLTSEGDG